MSNPQPWERVNPYAINRGRWFISKATVEGATLYVLHDASGVRYGHWESSDEAKDFADSLDRAASA
jgi:hypothetical protein